MDGTTNTEEGGRVLRACERFVGWLDEHGCESYDPYDIWGTRYGLWSRKVYYACPRIGAPLVAPLVALEMICPSLRRLFVRKDRFATADAQLVMAFLNLHEATGESGHLRRAEEIGRELLGYSVPGFSGPCWGYPFDWQNNKDEVWPKNTPYITCTPYCYEAYLGLAEATGDARYLDLARGIARFVSDDLKDLPVESGAAAGSYSPFDSRKVVNATAYRAYVLFDAGVRFGEERYFESARKNLRFVLEAQREDGGWPYAVGEGRSFIDHFHTCFNLKNLFKVHRLLDDAEVERSIVDGYRYYRRHLFTGYGLPRSFAVSPRFQVTTIDMYNFAEAITLGVLLNGLIPNSRALAEELADKLLSRYQLRSGCFVTRVFRGNIRHKFPFLRWPQAQLFFALTNLVVSLHRDRVAVAERPASLAVA